MSSSIDRWRTRQALMHLDDHDEIFGGQPYPESLHPEPKPESMHPQPESATPRWFSYRTAPPPPRRKVPPKGFFSGVKRYLSKLFDF